MRLPMLSLSKSQHPLQSFQLLVVLFILAIAMVTVLPSYVTGQWAWNKPPQVATLDALREVQKNGLTLPGWETLKHEIGEVSGHKWAFQWLLSDKTAPPIPSTNPVVLMLRPQTSQGDQPQVEWMDITGAQQWTADDFRRLTFVAPSPNPNEPNRQTEVQVNAQFFRGWTAERTYAVVQWYAWSTGGHSAASHWFWADQWMQWGDRQRMPWVAVSLMIPIKPVGDIESVRPLAESLGQAIQSGLMATALQP